MSTATAAPSVAGILEDVAKWRADEETRQKAELVEVDQEISSLEQAIANLQQQLEALAKFRDELVAKGAEVENQEISKGYTAVFDALRAQSETLGNRESAVVEAQKVREAALSAALAESDVAPLVQEYQQFREHVEPTLANLPDSYRGVVQSHHNSIMAKLQDRIATHTAGPVTVEADDVEVDMVFAVDAPEGTPELAILVLPVTEEVHSGWLERAEGVQTWVAARAMQALYETFKASGPLGAQAMCGGHQGLLAIEADLVGAGDDIEKVLEERLSAVFQAAPELGGGKVRVVPRKVPVDYLLPPETDDSETEAADA